jgi:hypothetical protein
VRGGCTEVTIWRLRAQKTPTGHERLN